MLSVDQESLNIQLNNFIQMTWYPEMDADAKATEYIESIVSNHTTELATKDLTSIIILTWNQLHCTRECLASIAAHTLEPYELIVVDNGSTDGTVAWLHEQTCRDDRIRLIENPSNHGFAAGCNQGLSVARGNYLVLLNNDVVVTPEWLSGLLECHRLDPFAGIVGPMTNNASGIQGLGNPIYDPGGLDGFARQFRDRNRHRRVASRRLVGFCMLLTRQLYVEIGGLDERFGSGNFEDDDFCLRAAIVGRRNMIAADVYVHHYGGASFAAGGIDYRAAIGGNWALFRDKWSAPVAMPAEAELIARCRLREELERLIMEERPVEALQRLAQAGGVMERDPLVTELRAQALWSMGREQEAASLLGSDSTFQSILEGRLALESGDLETAGIQFQTARSRLPGCGLPYLHLALLARQQGEMGRAVALLLKGINLSPTMPGYEPLLDTLIATDQCGELVRILKEAAHLYPDSRQVGRLLVAWANRAGQCEEVVAAAERFCIRFGPDEQVLAFGLSARRRLGEYRSAAPQGRRISLCMIVRDEELHIARCLTSCRPLVHEMVVVDTGSNDRTPELAELLGARLIRHQWRDDFSEARNASLEAATGDWLLVMDGDEALSPRDYSAFQKALEGAACPAAFTILTRNYTNVATLDGFTPLDSSYPEEEAGSGWTPSVKVRLFPNHCGIHFEGVVHEMVEGTIAQAGLPLREHPVPIHHYGGLENQRLNRKRTLYYTLGQQKLQVGNRDPKALYELAVQAAELERFIEAEELWLTLLEQEPEFSVAWFNLGYIYLKINRLREAMAATERALVLDPGYKAALLNLTLCRFCLLPAPEALAAVDGVAALHPEDRSIRILRHVALCLSGRLQEGIEGLRMLAADGCGMTDFLKSVARLLYAVERPEEGKILEALSGVFA
ncbi:hypothetical protein GSbR_13440 [Geobacter sp. SVR]|nr:hypothetical protein GSVR_42890 [Geobacter sp. SVR]GCF84744.1 hypothetical protein GSbR_13440 [Geobacter sp. SVR]